MLGFVLFAWLSAASAGETAADTVERPVFTGSRLSEAEQSVAALQAWRLEIARAVGDAMFVGDPDRLECLDGKDEAMLALIRASELARRDLQPSVLAGNHAKVERELGRVRVAVDRGASLRAEAARCASLRHEPIDPEPAPPAATTEGEDLAPPRIETMDLYFPR